MACGRVRTGWFRPKESYIGRFWVQNNDKGDAEAAVGAGRGRRSERERERERERGGKGQDALAKCKKEIGRAIPTVKDPTGWGGKMPW